MSSSSRKDANKSRSFAHDSMLTLEKYDMIGNKSFSVEQEKAQQKLLASDIAFLRELKGEIEATDWMFDSNCGSGSTASLVSK